MFKNFGLNYLFIYFFKSHYLLSLKTTHASRVKILDKTTRLPHLLNV